MRDLRKRGGIIDLVKWQEVQRNDIIHALSLSINHANGFQTKQNHMEVKCIKKGRTFEGLESDNTCIKAFTRRMRCERTSMY